VTDTTTTEEATTTTTAENPSQAESPPTGNLNAPAPSDGETTTSSSDESQATGETTTTTEESTTEESQTTEESTTEETGEGEAKPEGAPETYESFAAVEGVDAMGKVTDTAFRTVMKESNLSQEQAQNVLNQLAPAIKQDQLAKHSAQIQEWVNDCQTDAEIGGDKLAPAAAAAEKAFNTAASPELQKLVRESGIGNHPDFIKSWKWVADRMSDDNFVAGDPPKPAPKLQGNAMRNAKATAEVFYGKKND
jgi:hypothetical protein